MKAHWQHLRPGNLAGRRASGMSLLVMIALLAIIAIFALSLLRALIREIDHRVSRQESAMLKAQKNALEQAILRTGIIPAPNTWVTAVAAELGEQTNAVAINPRRQQRHLLIDPTGWLTNVTLPYTQNAAGATIKPVNARMMIVSSLGANGPYPSSTNFALFWNRRDDLDDMKVERILLDPLFVELRLATGKAAAQAGQYGLYAIGAPTNYYAAPQQQLTNAPRYLLRGTKVLLYTHTSLLDARQILTKNAFYRYEDGIWKSSAVGADLPGGLDLAAVVKGFLDAIPNTNALYKAAQQQMVVGAMMDYMRGYIAWGNAGFPSGTMKTQLGATQLAMMLRCQELFKESGGSANYFPINNGACQ